MNYLQRCKMDKLANFLSKLPKKHFDLEHVILLRNQGNKEDLEEIGKTFEAKQCGSVGCAMGWTPSVFPKDFSWHIDTWEEDGEQYHEAELVDVDGNHEEYDDMAMDFFGITRKEAYYLFNPEYYKDTSKEQVVKRMKKFAQTCKIDLKDDNFIYRGMLDEDSA